MAGQWLRWPGGPGAGLAALLLIPAGCAPHAAPRHAGPPVPPPPVPGYVDADQLLAVHPDAARLRELDQKIARARKGSRPLGEHPLQPPTVVELDTPVPPASRTAPPAEPDRERAVAAIREDFTIRRAARPEREEEAYRRALGRLRRRFLELRREPLPAESDNDLALALRNARRFSELDEQLRSLRERPEDRLFYTPAQLRRRRELYHLTEQELEALRAEEAARLENALNPKGQPLRNAEGTEREIPPAEIEKLEQERDQLRREALQQLALLERSEVQRVEETRLPAPAIEPAQPGPPAAEADDVAKERSVLEQRVQLQSPAADRRPGIADVSGPLAGEREELRVRLLEEVRAAVAAAARARGIVPTFARGKAPDRTRELRQAVAELLAGRARRGETIHEQKR